ncbi:GlxA family transcriptional regulator [Arthrobacter sp. MMS18-M83]|uniref:GlxA family transcriptional regulator n=1 Tax=Arthrobacter sp. MMS18-M83 TaxID=2996261 RepID=UPI00227CAEAE|nr:helix-turn-helix domain-containing protein [Arthrobacter sp. MMS18-M83]WAH98145.1 helix-turn-helix domain-containing protein [Arthrobacter sp. MMS18-M83]
MVRVVVIAPAETASITMTGLFDVIGKADRAFGALEGRPGRDTVFDVKLASLDGRPVHYQDRVTVNVDLAAEEVNAPDLVIVPGLDDDLGPSFALNAAWAPWLARWHAAGSVVASSCSGAFLIAEAGLLSGRTATTHWLYADEFRRRFPAARLAVQRLIIDHGDVITSGGATTFLDLALYLVERFAGRERANAAARVLLIDGARTSQLPYVTNGAGYRDHDDDLVRKAQNLIDAKLSGSIRVEDLAGNVGLSSRTLARRFHDAVGQAPQAYIQYCRVDTARRLLETGDSPIENIRRQVGYSDPTAFRRAFKEQTGLAPSEYRDRYGWTADAGTDHLT